MPIEAISVFAPCRGCGTKAQWSYMPGNADDVYCDDCVPRGCMCNTYPKDGDSDNQDEANWVEDLDEKGRRAPCCEFSYDEGGTWSSSCLEIWSMLNTVNVKFSCNSHHNDHVASLEYKQIVAMGKPVVPILIFLLEREDWIVTIALGEIMGELAPEIAEDDRGRLNQIIETWKGWWEKHKNEWSLNFPVV